MTADSGAIDTLRVPNYSFYLNVVVVDSNPSGSKDSDGAAEAAPATPAAEPAAEPEATVVKVPEEESSKKKGGEEIVVSTATTEQRQKYIMDGKALMKSITKRAQSFGVDTPNLKTPDAKKMFSDSKAFMGSIGSGISKGATAFVKSKTMVSRAEKAVNDAMPQVIDQIGVTLNMSKVFQHGPVFVLEVDMKGCDVFGLLQTTLGEEALQHYRQVRSGLEALELKETLSAFDKEIIPKVRKGLMSKTAELIPLAMKNVKGNSDLEIQCLALDDEEEAKYLFSFINFMDDMKQQAKLQ